MFPFTSPTVTIIAHLAMAVLVYHDQRLNGRSGIGWTFFVFLFGVYGLAIYILFNVDTIKLAAQRLRKKNLLERLSTPSRPQDGRIRTGTEFTLPPGLVPEPNDFVDEELERLLEKGDQEAAREYIDRMVRISGEMGDEETARRYQEYRERLSDFDHTG